MTYNQQRTKLHHQIHQPLPHGGDLDIFTMELWKGVAHREMDVQIYFSYETIAIHVLKSYIRGRWYG